MRKSCLFNSQFLYNYYTNNQLNSVFIRSILLNSKLEYRNFNEVNFRESRVKEVDISDFSKVKLTIIILY
jgi:uncharacterized protein YjbI with pentapeptide repeats